jgi:hypothetical protein
MNIVFDDAVDKMKLLTDLRKAGYKISFDGKEIRVMNGKPKQYPVRRMARGNVVYLNGKDANENS